MKVLLVIVILAAVGTFVAMKLGKVKDANNNNIPDALEDKVAEVKEEVQEVVKKAKKVVSKKPAKKK